MNCGKLVRDFESCCSKRGTGADVSYDSEQVAAVYRGNYEVERILDRREHKCVVAVLQCTFHLHSHLKYTESTK